MPLTKIAAENFTVFEDIKIPFCEGLNVLVGENGVGKTHIMKLAYAACQASKHDVSFSQKTTMLFRPDQSGIGRLVNRGKSGSNKAMVSVESDTAKIGMTFSTKTRKWDAEINSEEKWEKQMSDLTSVFIPAKEILSNAWNLDAAVKMGNVEFDDTYLDIIAAAKIDISRGVDSTVRKKYLDILQKISNGKVTLHEDRFYLKPGTQAKLEFNLVAEGLRKIALLWQLIKNGTLEKGSVLFWDEPEANINPKYIPVLAELLIMLETEGVQIFVSTHDYFLSKYIEVKRRQDSYEHFLKIRERELGRLRCSFEGAKAAGYEKFIMFLHYPPTSIGEMESPFTLMAQEFGAEKVIYSHCHGEKRYDDSFKGYVDGIEYKLVSGDYLNFKPELVLR